MKELKFRAWHKPDNTYYKVCSIAFDYNSLIDIQLWTNDGQPTAFRPWDLDDIILEQYTGLKDKKGKEIYEGDIVVLDEFIYRNQFDPVTYGFIDSEYIYDGKLMGIVKYSNHGGFYIDIKKRYDEQDEKYFKEKSRTKRSLKGKEKREVIGNIHENGDLLK